MSEDQEERRRTGDPASKHPQSEDSQSRWSYRCPRLNRRLQSNYRQFFVNPSGDEAEDLSDQSGSDRDQADDDRSGQDQQSFLFPGFEVDVEPAPVMEEETGLSPDDSFRDQPQQARETASEPDLDYPGRQGLRAIFSTESDSADDVPEVPQAQSETPQVQPEVLRAQTEDTAEQVGTEVSERVDQGGQSDAGEPRDPRDSDRESDRVFEPPGQGILRSPPPSKIVWKSFPKPLRDK